jgi:hypothetical protein
MQQQLVENPYACERFSISRFCPKVYSEILVVRAFLPRVMLNKKAVNRNPPCQVLFTAKSASNMNHDGSLGARQQEQKCKLSIMILAQESRRTGNGHLKKSWQQLQQL